MPALANPRHEHFAQRAASGKYSDMEAFRMAGYAQESAQQNACRLRANESVSARTEELRARNAEKSEITRAEVIAILAAIVCAKPSEASLENPLCETVVGKAGPSAVFPSKLCAITQLAKMCGWNEAEKFEHGASNELTELLKRLRGGG